jgi:hypothetical protein
MLERIVNDSIGAMQKKSYKRAAKKVRLKKSSGAIWKTVAALGAITIGTLIYNLSGNSKFDEMPLPDNFKIICDEPLMHICESEKNLRRVRSIITDTNLVDAWTFENLANTTIVFKESDRKGTNAWVRITDTDDIIYMPEKTLDRLSKNIGTSIMHEVYHLKAKPLDIKMDKKSMAWFFKSFLEEMFAYSLAELARDKAPADRATVMKYLKANIWNESSLEKLSFSFSYADTIDFADLEKTVPGSMTNTAGYILSNADFAQIVKDLGRVKDDKYMATLRERDLESLASIALSSFTTDLSQNRLARFIVNSERAQVEKHDSLNLERLVDLNIWGKIKYAEDIKQKNQ